MLRSLLAGVIAAGLIVPAAADAATIPTHRRHVAHHSRILRGAPVRLYHGYRTPGPPWSGPNQCWEDLGYGRYESCDQ